MNVSDASFLAVLLISMVVNASGIPTVHTTASTLPEDYFLLTSPPSSGHANNIIQLGQRRCTTYFIVLGEKLGSIKQQACFQTEIGMYQCNP